MPVLTWDALRILVPLPKYDQPPMRTRDISKATGMNTSKITGIIEYRLKLQYVELVKIPRTQGGTMNAYRRTVIVTDEWLQEML